MAVLTQGDLLRAGACARGVRAWVAMHAPDRTAMSVEDLLRMTTGNNRRWIMYAAELDGCGDGCENEGNGDGFGYGYGAYGFADTDGNQFVEAYDDEEDVGHYGDYGNYGNGLGDGDAYGAPDGWLLSWYALIGNGFGGEA